MAYASYGSSGTKLPSSVHIAAYTEMVLFVQHAGGGGGQNRTPDPTVPVHVLQGWGWARGWSSIILGFTAEKSLKICDMG